MTLTAGHAAIVLRRVAGAPAALGALIAAAAAALLALRALAAQLNQEVVSPVEHSGDVSGAAGQALVLYHSAPSHVQRRRGSAAEARAPARPCAAAANAFLRGAAAKRAPRPARRSSRWSRAH